MVVKRTAQKEDPEGDACGVANASVYSWASKGMCSKYKNNCYLEKTH